MSNIIRMAQFSLRNNAKIQKICAPIYETFGVKHFWCSKTFKDGSFFCIGSNPDLHDIYYNSKSYLHNPFFRNPNLIQPGYYFHKDYDENEYKNTVDYYVKNLKTEFCAVRLIKTQDTLIRFGYATEPCRVKQFNNILINNTQLFQRFHEYFLSETKKLFAQADDYFIDLKSELGSLYDEKLVFPNLLNIHQQCDFLDKLGMIESEKVHKLSRQEKVCLKYLAQGYSSIQIALATHLSVRTVEHYLESIKNKLSCFSKHELYRYAALLESSSDFFG